MKLKILLVDDSDVNKKFFVKLLKMYNMFCDVASNGEEAVNAFAMKGDAEKCLEAGMDEYLSKPIITEQVINLIHKYSNKSSDFNVHNSFYNDFEEVLTALMNETSFSRNDCEELVVEFYQHAHDLIEKTKYLLSEGKVEEVKINLHQLKGSSANIRAKKILNLLLEAEEAMKNGNSELADNIMENLISLLII